MLAGIFSVNSTLAVPTASSGILTAKAETSTDAVISRLRARLKTPFCAITISYKGAVTGWSGANKNLRVTSSGMFILIKNFGRISELLATARRQCDWF